MPDIIDMPKLSDTMKVGTLVKWLKKEGDDVKSGDIIAEVETDKATMELESFFSGTLLKIFAPSGSQVPIGAPLCAVGQPGEIVTPPAALPQPPKPDYAAAAALPQSVPAPARATPPPAPEPSLRSQELKPQDEPRSSSPGESEPVSPVAEPQVPASGPDRQVSEHRLRVSPLARKLAASENIDLTRITGSGPHGRIVKADVLAAVANPTLLKSAPGSPPPASGPSGLRPQVSGLSGSGNPIQPDRIVPATNMRATIARRLVEAKTQIPHFYLELEVDAAPLLAVRTQLNTAFAKDGVKLSVNDFVLKGCVEALRRVPGVNASWTGSGLQYHGAVHISFAVAIEDGLITPVIRDAHRKSIFTISAEARPLGQRAREKKLKPDEFTGGTFCVSNLGMMGIERFSAIINPPNAAILAVGAAVAKPVVKNGAVVVGSTMALTLSCDHRVVDGALGTQFLVALKDLLEQPALLLV